MIRPDPTGMRSAVFLIATVCVLSVSGQAASATREKDRGAPAPLLSVTSEPAGAAVFVDGKAKGQTPLSLADVALGRHRVRVERPGYLENARLVEVLDGQTAEVRVNLTPLPGARVHLQAEGPTSGTGAPDSTAPSVEGAEKKSGSKLKYILPAAVVAAGGGFAIYKVATKNHPPVAAGRISGASSGLAKLTTFQFDASASTDPDNDALQYAWTFGDGATGTGVRVTHSFATAGSFPVGLTVSDGKATSATQPSTVTVTEVLPPLVDPAPPNAALQSATPAALSARTTTDPDGDTLSYSWSFGDGATGTGQGLAHVYDTAGDRTVTLTTSDGKNAATSSTPVRVKSMTGVWRGSTWGGYTLTLTQVGSTISGTYLDGDGPGVVRSGRVVSPRFVEITVNQDLGPVLFVWYITCTVDMSVDTCSGSTTMTRQ